MAALGDKTTVEKLLDAAEVSGSMTRNAAIDMLDNFTDKEYAIPYEDIGKGEQYMTSPKFIKTLGDMSGLYDYDTKGSNWLESAAKGTLEFGVDVLTDPITYLGLGAGKAAQLGAKGAGAGVKGARLAGLLGDAATSGGAVGALMEAEDTSQRFLQTMGGVGAGLALGKTIDLGGKALKAGGNLAIDATYKRIKPEAVEALEKFGLRPSEAYEISKSANSRLKNTAQEISDYTQKIIDDRGEAEVTAAWKNMQGYEKMYEAEREDILKFIHTSTGKKATPDEFDGVKHYLNKKYADLAQQDGTYTPAMVDLIKRNRYMVNDVYNKAWKGKKSRLDVPIDFHTQHMVDPNDLAKMTSKNIRGKTGFSRRKMVKDSNVDTIAALKAEPDKFVHKLMEKEELASVGFMDRLRNETYDVDNVQGYVKGYDALLGRAKKSMLTLNDTWVKNNFVENILRAYMQGGVGSALDVGTGMGKVLANHYSGDRLFKNSKMVQDIRKLMTNGADNATIEWAEKDGLSQVARNYGATGGDFFSHGLESADEVIMARSLKGDKWVAEKLAEQEARSMPTKALDAVLDKSGQLMGNAGRKIENAARLISFKHTVNDLVTPEMKSLVKK